MWYCTTKDKYRWYIDLEVQKWIYDLCDLGDQKWICDLYDLGDLKWIYDLCDLGTWSEYMICVI